MGICWYCYWGWPKVVADIYKKALGKLGGDDSPLIFGPSHVVWEDENFHSAERCIADYEKEKHYYVDRFVATDLEIVIWSLKELAKIPLKDRCVEPETYDDENPRAYPPPFGVEMVRM